MFRKPIRRLKKFLRPIVIAFSGLALASLALATVDSLTGSEIRQRIQGNTGTFPTSDLEWVRSYFAPDGSLRGTYEGKRFEGRWFINGNQLCLDLPDDHDDGCRTVIKRADNGLQLFTTVGEPAGDLYLENGNPHDF